MDFPSSPWLSSLAAGFPGDTTLLTASHSDSAAPEMARPVPSSFWCNPSSIDGLGITDSSQGGGGIFVHGWGITCRLRTTGSTATPGRCLVAST